jgi:hypothetical protein
MKHTILSRLVWTVGLAAALWTQAGSPNLW